MRKPTKKKPPVSETATERTAKIDRHGMIYYDNPSSEEMHQCLALMAERLRNPPKPRPGQTQHEANLGL